MAEPRKPAPPKAPAPAKEPAPAPAEPAAPPPRAEIHARLEKGRPKRFEVAPGGTVLGRDDQVAVPILRDGISREHARIEWDGKAWWVSDLKSTNGTFLNGERIVREKLQHLDVISLGRNVDIIFTLRTAAPPVVRKGIVRAALVADDGAITEIAAGEITLGRSSACNVVAEENAVSKVHARIERSSDQLLLEDLGSSNGTFVNGNRVRTAVLRDTDTIELAGAARFKVVIEQGDVSGSGVFRVSPPTKEDEPRFSREWKTRFQWDSQELAAIAAAVAGRPPAEAAPGSPSSRASAATPMPPGKGKTASMPAIPTSAAAAAAAPPGAASTPPAPEPKAPPAPAPAPKAPPAAAPPPKAPPAAAGSPAPKPAPVAAKPEPVAPKPAPAAAKPAPPAAPAPPPPSPAERPIAAARLTGDKGELTLTVPGRVELGRTASGFRIDHPTVSRRHAAVTLSDDRRHLLVEDLGAANTTRVNGKPIEGRRELAPGDVIQLGEVRLTVALDRG